MKERIVAIMQADVDALLAGELGDWLAEQSTMRSQAKTTAWTRLAMGGAAYVAILGFVWIALNASFVFAGFVAFGGLVGLAFWCLLPVVNATKQIKIGINSAIARSLGVSYQHDVTTGPEFAAARTYGLVPSFARAQFEDRWSGELEGHRFSLYEAHLERRETSRENRTRYVTVFRGAIIDMDFGRPFTSTTLLQRAGAHKRWFGLGRAKDSVAFDGHQLDLVDQVHPAFEDVFALYSDDQVDARVLVNPAYIEHLIALESAFKGDALRALLSKGRVIVAVESSELFESGSLSEHKDREKVAEAAEQFAALARLALAINQTERGSALGNAGPPDARALGTPSGLKRR